MATTSRLLSLPVLAVAFPVLFALYFIVGAIANYRQLRQFKGPPLAAFSRLWIFRHELRTTLYQAEKDALRQYGSPARIGPNLLITDDPDVVKHMAAPGSKWTRSRWYDGMKLDPRTDSVFSTRDENVHANLRSKEASGYNGRDVDTLESDMDARILDLVRLISTHYHKTSMDFASVARYFTLDVLSTVAFGRPFGFMEANEDLWDYNKENVGFITILEMCLNHVTIYRIIASPIMQALAAPKVTDKKGMGPALAFARKAVAERFSDDASKPKNDMLNSFKNKGLDQVQCETEAYLQIIAGSDSTTTILRCIMYSLAGNPVAYLKLRSEIDGAAASGQLTTPVAKYTEVQKLPYLNACIWEGIRMFPPLFGLKSKLAPPGGDTIKGIYYPEGTEVGLCDDAMCRRKDIFGEDADVFRPDRWIEADAETKTKFTRTVDSIFGSGRWTCLGRHIAMLELHKVFTELMRHFDWAIADPMKGIDMFSHAIHVQWNMNLIARPRE